MMLMRQSVMIREQSGYPYLILTEVQFKVERQQGIPQDFSFILFFREKREKVQTIKSTRQEKDPF